MATKKPIWKVSADEKTATYDGVKLKAFAGLGCSGCYLDEKARCQSSNNPRCLDKSRKDGLSIQWRTGPCLPKTSAPSTPKATKPKAAKKKYVAPVAKPGYPVICLGRGDILFRTAYNTGSGVMALSFAKMKSTYKVGSEVKDADAAECVLEIQSMNPVSLLLLSRAAQHAAMCLLSPEYRSSRMAPAKTKATPKSKAKTKTKAK